MTAVAPPNDALGSLLEESKSQPQSPSQLASTSTSSSPAVPPPPPPLETEDGESIPTLSSLLLSTAQSLVERSQTLSTESAFARRAGPFNTSTITKLQPPASANTATPTPAPFSQLHHNPGALLGDASSNEYLASLLAMPLSTLQSLPTTLAALSKSLDTDLSSLAFTRYSAFLLTHSATQSISQSFNTLSDSLTALLDSTSALEAAAATFEQRVDDVRRKRDRMSRVQERIDEVEELLEAPAVVDACVRAGYWGEAIDVAVRLSELHERLKASKEAKRWRSNKPSGVVPNGTVAKMSELPAEEGDGALLLLQRVRNEVALALLSLRARVIDSLLQRGLKLPGAVRGIGILRRIGGRGFGGAKTTSDITSSEANAPKELDEESLRIVFLAARWRCLRGELDAVEGQMAASGIKLDDSKGEQLESTPGLVGAEENEERTRWTKRWIEVWREIVGETVGMYTEVFLSPSTSSQAITNGDDSSKDHSLPAAAPLTLFVTTALTSLSGTLAHAIPALTSPSSLSSLLTQLSYCSHSFARYGLDFRELQQLRQRVEARVGRIVVLEWEAAGRAWEKEWRDGWEGTGPHAVSLARRANLLGGRAPISDWLVVPEGLAQVFATPMPPPLPSDVAPTTWHHQPQQALALLPPLARFLNAHASALNSLRLLPPLALYPSLRLAQARELDRATQVLAAFTDAWLASTHGAAAARTSASGSKDDANLSNDERRVKALREDEKRLITTAIAWLGRWVVPWIEGGLHSGVYGNASVSTATTKEPRASGVADAIRRTEGLIARIEGREVESAAPKNTPTTEPKDQPESTVAPQVDATPVERMAVLPADGMINPAIVEPTLEGAAAPSQSVTEATDMLDVPDVAPPTAESIGET